jgi:lipoate synthase
MKLALLFDPGYRRTTRVGVIKNNGRGSGAHYICEVARNSGVDATNIDYWLEWDQSVLIDSLLSWFKDEQDCWIALSGSIDGSSVDQFKQLAADIKKKLPTIKVMLGGFRVPVGSKDWVDISFIGRSVNIFEKWLRNEDLSEYLFCTNPLTYKNATGKILEDPVCPIPHAGDFWSSNETLTVEMALGCKFNCSFCGYDFRNNRKPVLSDKERLRESLIVAHDKFGISKFVLADDTTNEVDRKLELLGDIVENLHFVPEFAGFARLDIVSAKPHQIELMKRARMTSVFFGIESLTPDATKLMRKGGRPENNYKALELFRDKFPECFTYGNFIVGLTGDTEKDIWYHAERIVKEQLLTSAGCNPLRLYEDLANPDVMSDIDKDPAKFGYTVLEDELEWKELGYNSKKWKNDWTNVDEATELSLDLDRYWGENLVSKYTAHEIQGIKALLPEQPFAAYNSQLNLANRVRSKMVRKYIQQKSNWLQGL